MGALRPIVHDDRGARPNYSVHVSEDRADFHRLYRGECPVLRTLSGERLLNALGLHLRAHSPLEGGRLRFDVCAVLFEGSVTIMPATLGSVLDGIDRRLQAAGAVRLDLPHVDIDPDRLEVVVDEGFDLQRQAVLQHIGSRRREAFVTGGRFPIAAWLVDQQDLSSSPRTPASNVYDAWSALSGGTHHAIGNLLPRLRDVSALMVPEPITMLPSKSLLDLVLEPR